MDPENDNRTAVVETEEVIAPGHTYTSVSDRVTDMVLTWPIGIRWAAGLALALGLLFVLESGARRRIYDRRWGVGNQHPGRLGLRHHEFCVVDRNRTRGHPDLRFFAADAAAMAHVD